MHKVFVYGTLKRGYGNHVLINKSNILSLKAKAPGINLYSSGSIPFAARGNGTAIGELYEVDSIVLEKLDKLEGHPVFYKREKTKVQLVGLDGNAFSIIARVINALRNGLHEFYNLNTDEINKIIKEFKTEAMQISYDHLLQTVMRYVDVR